MKEKEIDGVEIIEDAEIEKVPNNDVNESGNQSDWSKRNGYNPGPDYNFSRFKKSKWEWFGEFIGIGIFAFVCNYLLKACFVLVLCLVCLPVSGQNVKRSYEGILRKNQQHIDMISRGIRQQEFKLRKQQQLLEKALSDSKEKNNMFKQIIKKRRQLIEDIKKRKQLIEEYGLPLSSFKDIQNPRQVYDSAFICLSMADTLNYIKYIKRSVSANYPLAMYAYGISILGGIGIKSNREIGLFYIKNASEKDCADATYYIAELYESGDYGYKKDSIMALQYYEKSAEQGSFEGKVTSGDIYYDGGDTLKAIKYWKSAYEHGKKNLLIKEQEKELARVAYNLWYFSRLNPEKEIETRGYMKTLAELGYVDGQVWYGDYCMQGYGMERDSAQAVYWYKQAALQNHVGAMQVLPFYYYDAHENDSTILWGTKPECRDSADIQYIVGAAYYQKEDYENAEVWWKKAVAQKYPDALWSMYCLCDVHKADSVLAFDYLKQAVDAKYPDALNDMGCNYVNGEMVEKNIEKAKELFQEAIDLGCVKAYYNMGNLYSYKGYIKKPNWEVAVGYYRQGAEKNEPLAQYNYGWCLKKGKGVKKDKKAAIYWLKKAAKQGNEDAISDLREMGVDGF